MFVGIKCTGCQLLELTKLQEMGVGGKDQVYSKPAPSKLSQEAQERERLSGVEEGGSKLNKVLDS